MGPTEIVIVLLLVTWLPALVVAGMKARWVWFGFGVLLGLPAYVGALLPARPGSAWARRGR